MDQNPIILKQMELDKAKKKLKSLQKKLDAAAQKLESDPESTLYLADYTIAKADVISQNIKITIIEQEILNLKHQKIEKQLGEE